MCEQCVKSFEEMQHSFEEEGDFLHEAAHSIDRNGILDETPLDTSKRDLFDHHDTLALMMQLHSLAAIRESAIVGMLRNIMVALTAIHDDLGHHDVSLCNDPLCHTMTPHKAHKHDGPPSRDRPGEN